MLVHTKKHLTDGIHKSVFCVLANGQIFDLPLSIIKQLNKYIVKDLSTAEKAKAAISKTVNIAPDEIFTDLNHKYTKAGALLKALRIREGLTQKDLALQLNIKQGDLSKMESGKRSIGKIIALRIAKKFDINYRSLLG